MERMNKVLRIGTRGSALALWQAQFVQQQLIQKNPSLHTEIVTIKTTGDKQTDIPLPQIGSKGIFTKEIEEALFEQTIDIAVHSLKDLPSQLPQGLIIGAITQREDPRDAFCSHPEKHHLFTSLPHNATIATGSIRRKAHLLAIRPDLKIVDIRGNVPTRLQKLDASDWDGLILAKAGIVRLGLEHRISETLGFDIILPAAGQGAIAIEVRAEDSDIINIVHTIHHQPTATAVLAERALMEALDAGCQVPLGAFAWIENNTLLLTGALISTDGKKHIRSTLSGNLNQPLELGKTVANELLSHGGKELLKDLRLHFTFEEEL